MEKLAAVDIGKQFLLDFSDAGSGISTTLGYQSLGNFISAVLPNIYILASLILFFLLIGGGLMFIINAGQNNPEAAAKGKQAVVAAVAGFVIIFASYWLIQIAEILTGLEIFGSRF